LSKRPGEAQCRRRREAAIAAFEAASERGTK
jgi:hypothetical protein